GFAGLSGVDQLFIIDEASGLPDDHFAAIAGNMLGGGTILSLSNPTNPEGWFADIFLSRKGERWHKFTLSSLDAPQDIPGLASREEVERWRAELGEDSSDWKIHVLGEHVTGDDGGSFSRELVDDAMSRPLVNDSKTALQIGIDPAGEGK